jgi:hypothetical protein
MENGMWRAQAGAPLSTTVSPSAGSPSVIWRYGTRASA